MADFWPGRQQSQIQDDLEITQIQLESLSPSQDDYRTTRMELENRIKYLKHELDRSMFDEESYGYDGTQDPYESTSTAYHDHWNDSFDTVSPQTGASSSQISLQNGNGLQSPSMILPNRKRQRESSGAAPEFQQVMKSRRPTPSPSQSLISSPSISSSDGFGDDDTLQRIFGSDIGNEYRGLSKESKRAERELRERQEQEKRDAEFARALQEEWNQPSISQPPPNPRSTSQSLLDRTTGGIRAMPPPPIPSAKSEQNKASPASQLPSTYSTFSKPDWSFDSLPGSFPQAGASNILDLGSDDDDDDEFQVISRDEFRPNPNRPSRSRPMDLTLADATNSLWGGSPFAGSGGTNVYNYPRSGPSNPAYDLLDHQIDSFGTPALGFTNRGAFGNTTGVGLLPSFPPIDLTIPTWGNWRDRGDEPVGNTEEEIKNLLENIRPDEGIVSDDSEGDPEAMKIPLMAHQKLGLAWMKSMEEGSNKGGILADDMGLGKTIQALALIVSRPSEDRQQKTTLIVAPVALMQQWKREIEQKIRTTHQLSTLILHGSDRNRTWRDLKHYDIVLTTYGTLATEIKRKTMWDTKKKANPNIKPSSKDDNLPILGDECRWYRVILDESQHIKNKATKAALGAWHIRSTYRWCMSGTPMMNNVFELFSLIHFLRIKPYNSLESFNRDFARPLKSAIPSEKDNAMRALQILLKAILLRRTKKSEINGQPIIQLPPKTIEVAHGVFSEDEQQFYDALENKAQLTFNKYLKAGSVGRNYSNVLVLLLRLRQACCHPHLIKDFSIDTGLANSEVDLKANAEAFSQDVVTRLREIEAYECPVCMDGCENPQIFFPCGHATCLECFAAMADAARAQGDEGRIRIKCPNCRAEIDPARITDLNTFRLVHFPSADTSEAAGTSEQVEENSDSETETGSDSEDSDESSESADDDDSIKDFVVEDDDEAALKTGDSSDDDLSSRPAAPKKTKEAVGSKVESENDSAKERKAKKTGKEKAKKRSKKKGKGKAKERDKLEKNQLSLAHLRKEGLRNKEAKRKYLKRLAEDWITSAKIEKTMEVLTNVHNRGQHEKTIVFSAFTSLLDLLEVPIHRQSWDYRRYDGSMSPVDRNKAVNDFSDKRSCTIMLVSLKAGNAGLNLTAANNVVIFDPFWNPYIEEQAIDRAYRIGQQKEVYVHRIIVEKTVEDRILALQEKKRELIENALDENAGRSVSRLGERELAYLFGLRRDT